MARPIPVAPEPLDNNGWSDWMDVAIQQAQFAADMDEAPIGAALFSLDGRLIAAAHNQPISLNDPTGHAEILCLRKAADFLENYRLTNTVLVVTLEPCIMCVGAILHARVSGVVFGAYDKKRGALVSNMDSTALPFTNHKIWQVGGVKEDECVGMLQDFFQARRKKK